MTIVEITLATSWAMPMSNNSSVLSQSRSLSWKEKDRPIARSYDYKLGSVPISMQQPVYYIGCCIELAITLHCIKFLSVSFSLFENFKAIFDVVMQALYYYALVFPYKSFERAYS